MSQQNIQSPVIESPLLRTPPISPINLGEHTLSRIDLVATIDRWNSRQVAHYIASFPVRECNHNGCPPGFAILNRRLISRQDRSRHYPDPATLPENQRQSHGECGSSTFDKALVALVGPCVVGVLYCEWLQFPMEGGFWGYNLSFVDVHEAWRGHGIGSSLVKHLNHEPWLKGKILCLTSHTELGQKHLAHVIDREITSTDFLVKQPWY